MDIARGGLGCLAAWHLPVGPVGLASKWAATSNVEIGHTTYPVNMGRFGWRGDNGLVSCGQSLT